jgi:uncharacterized protein
MRKLSRCGGERLKFPMAENPFKDDKKPNYLKGISDFRADNILDGLITNGNPLGTGGGWTNTITGLGAFGRDKVLQGTFLESVRIDDAQLSAMFNGNDLCQRIVCAKAKEMFRRGWVLTFPGTAKDGPDAPTAVKGPTTMPGAAKTPENAPPPPNGTGATAKGAARGDAYGSGKKPQSNDPTQTAGNEGANGSEPGPAAPGATALAEPPKPADAQGSGGHSQNDNADLAKSVEDYAHNLACIPRLREATIFGRAYGGGILVMGLDDGQDVQEPLDEAKIKSIKYLTWIDRRFVVAYTYYEELGPKFGEVEVYNVINPFGNQKNTLIHESRVLRFEGAPVDLLMRRRLAGWTLSVLQAPYDTLRQFDTSFQAIANLMSDMSQAVMKINGLANLISTDQKTLQTRMQMVDISRSSARMLYIDAENEEFSREPTPLTGVADTLQIQMLRLAAAAEMPVAILFGREPSGLNATGDADFRRFYDMIAGDQKDVLEPKLKRLYTLICLAKDSPTKGVLPGGPMQFVWHKLYEPSELEQSTIRFNMANADSLYVEMGALLPEEVAMSRFRNGDLNLDTEIQDHLRRAKIAAAELPPNKADEAKTAEKDKKDAKVTAATDAKTSADQFDKQLKVKAKPPGRADSVAWDDAGERCDSAPDDVHNMMSEDFPDKAISWVHSAPWRGPASVKLKNIDYSNKHKWQASHPDDAERVEKFKQMIKHGAEVKPLVLVQKPSGKAVVVDGHHRALAYQQLGVKFADAYIAKVGKHEGPWDETHDMQRGSKSG